MVSHSQHHPYIQGEFLYLQILSKHKEGYYPTHKEFHLYDYLQSQEKKEEGKYVGEFKDGKPHGQGTYTFTSGSKYTGELKDGLWNGQGTFTFPNGNKGIGEFSENKPLNITEYDKDGNIIGKYVNGNRIKQ